MHSEAISPTSDREPVKKLPRTSALGVVNVARDEAIREEALYA